MRILMIGDIIGKPGRRAVRSILGDLRREHSIDMVIANGENVAGGFGITLDTAYELLESGVDVITSGNHIWDQKEIIPHLDEGLPILRPANYPDAPGRGYLIQEDVMVMNLMGRVFMPALDCPFRIMPKGTAYLSDVGMTGPVDSVIGSEPEDVLTRFLTGMPHRLAVAGGPVKMNSVLLDIDTETGRARSIERLDIMES